MNKAGDNLDLSSIHLVDTKTLRREFERVLGITRSNIEYLAAIWSELATRDEQPPKLAAPWNHILPLVASGTLTSRAALVFGGSRSKAAIISTLPQHEQDRLAEEDAVTVVVPTNDPRRQEITAKQVSVSGLPTKALERVIVGGRVLSPDEQRRSLPTPSNSPSRLVAHRFDVSLTPRQYQVVERLAHKDGKNPHQWVESLILREIEKEKAKK